MCLLEVLFVNTIANINNTRGRRGRDHMVVKITATYAIYVYYQ